MSLFLCMCGLHFSLHALRSGRAAVVWAVNKGLCPGFIQPWTLLSEQMLFLEFPRGKVVRNPALEHSRGECSSVSVGLHAGSAAGGSVREDPVSCRRVLARSPESKVLRKHSSYSIGLLLLPGNTLSTFWRFVLVAPILAQQFCPTTHG